MIGLIIFETSYTFETIKTYILNIEQKLSSFAFFVIDKINITFSQRPKHKY